MDVIHDGWQAANGKARAAFCKILQSKVKNYRPENGFVQQLDQKAMMSISEENIAEMVDLVKVMTIMRTKNEEEGTSGYSSSDYERWTMTIDGVCAVMKIGMTSVGIFDDRKRKDGGKEPRNRNSALTSIMKHLSEKHKDLHKELSGKLEAAFKALEEFDDYKGYAAEYRKALTFDQGKVSEDEDSENLGIYTGMANIDWLLLAAYNCKKVDMTVDE